MCDLMNAQNAARASSLLFLAILGIACGDKEPSRRSYLANERDTMCVLSAGFLGSNSTNTGENLDRLTREPLAPEYALASIGVGMDLMTKGMPYLRIMVTSCLKDYGSPSVLVDRCARRTAELDEIGERFTLLTEADVPAAMALAHEVVGHAQALHVALRGEGDCERNSGVDPPRAAPTSSQLETSQREFCSQLGAALLTHADELERATASSPPPLTPEARSRLAAMADDYLEGDFLRLAVESCARRPLAKHEIDCWPLVAGIGREVRFSGNVGQLIKSTRILRAAAPAVLGQTTCVTNP